MAPTVPKKRPSIRTKTSSKSATTVRAPPNHRPGAVISDSFINSKADKRTIKHSAFINRIEKAHKKPLKRRRPNKKLITTLESLADALPELEAVQRSEGGAKKIKVESLTHGKGLMKRREKVEQTERERFGRNLAGLMRGSGTENKDAGQVHAGGEAAKVSANAGRFAAIRNWVKDNMEEDDAFVKKRETEQGKKAGI